MFVREQPGRLQDPDDALHVAREREAVMGQDQQLCSWGHEAVVRQGYKPGKEGEGAYTDSPLGAGPPPVL